MKNILIILCILIIGLIYFVFFTPKEEGVLYKWDDTSLPAYTFGSNWKTFAASKRKNDSLRSEMESGKYIGETKNIDNEICNFFSKFNNLLFSCSYPHGIGVYIDYGFSVYTGEFKYGERHGHGTLVYTTDRMSYRQETGKWENGSAHDTINRDMYGNIVGKTVNGKTQSFKIASDFSDGTYKGEWKDLKWHGQGIFIYSDGRKYEGQWENGEFHGLGTLTFLDGSEYKGNWKEHRRHGQSTYTFADGLKLVRETKGEKKMNDIFYDKKGKIILEWTEKIR